MIETDAYSEDLQKDQEKLQKRIERDTTGRWRRKHAHDMLDDDDYSDDEWGVSAKRRNGDKRRRIDNDKLESLAQDPEKKGFYESYRQGLDADENMDIAFLQPEEQVGEKSDADDDEADDDEEEQPVQTQVYSHAELRKEAVALAEARRAAEQIQIPDARNPFKTSSSPGSELKIVDRTAVAAIKVRGQQLAFGGATDHDDLEVR